MSPIRPSTFRRRDSGIYIPSGGSAGGGGGAFDPLAIPGLQALYKADAGTSTTTDGVAISQWNDQSSNARHLTGAGTAQPLYKAAILNGLPVVRFDGINDLLTTAAFNNPTTVSLFAVLKLANITQNHHIFIHTAAGTWTTPYARLAMRTQAAGPVWQAFIQDGNVSPNNYASGGVPNTTTAHLVELHVAGASGGQLILDGTLLATSVGVGPLTQSNFACYMGCNPGLTALDFMAADVGEVIYASNQSAQGILDARNYLKTKWATP